MKTMDSRDSSPLTVIATDQALETSTLFEMISLTCELLQSLRSRPSMSSERALARSILLRLTHLASHRPISASIRSEVLALSRSLQHQTPDLNATLSRGHEFLRSR